MSKKLRAVSPLRTAHESVFICCSFHMCFAFFSSGKFQVRFSWALLRGGSVAAFMGVWRLLSVSLPRDVSVKLQELTIKARAAR